MNKQIKILYLNLTWRNTLILYIFCPKINFKTKYEVIQIYQFIPGIRQIVDKIALR
jgi:hypothetical protein